MGIDVIGDTLKEPAEPSLFDVPWLASNMNSIEGGYSLFDTFTKVF